MEKLTFRLEEIPAEGLAFELAPDPAIFGISEVTVVNPPGVGGWVKIVREHADLLVSGAVKALIEVPCSRCLGKARVPVEGEFSFRMVSRSRMPREEESELTTDDLDVEFFDGDQVDVRSIVAEQVYLGVPLRALCRPECRGLCPRCGQDLNVRDCGHRSKDADSRWSPLRQLGRKSEET